MDYNEFKELIARLKESGLNDNQIMNVLLKAYETKQCSSEDFEIMVGWLGYELDDIFYEIYGIRRKK